MDRLKDKKKILNISVDILFFAALAITLSVFFFRLVYCQTIYAGRQDGYPSDILAYMQTIQGIDSGYSFPYPLFFWLGRFFCLFMPIDYAVTWVEVILNLLAIVATKFYFEKLVKKQYPDTDSLVRHLAISFITVSCFMLSMWWLPRFGNIHLPFKYQVFTGTYSGNPWHNATYIATRPFAIIAFFSFAEILESYEKELKVKDAIIFGASLFLSTIAKPSFTFVFATGVGIALLFNLIRSRFKNFKNTMLLVICFLPTFAALIYQFRGVFVGSGDGGEHGIGFGFFELWSFYAESVPAAIFYANAFALICIICFFKDIRDDKLYRFTLLFFAVSVLEAGLMYEKGDRYLHFNFDWGYMHGIFFFQLVCAIKLFKQTLSRKKIPLVIICWIFFAIHLVAGIFYFRGIYYGRDYSTLLPISWILPQ